MSRFVKSVTCHVLSRFVKSHICHVLGCQVRETIARAAALGVFSQMEGLEEYPLAELTIGLGEYNTLQYSTVQFISFRKWRVSVFCSLLTTVYVCLCVKSSKYYYLTSSVRHTIQSQYSFTVCLLQSPHLRIPADPPGRVLYCTVLYCTLLYCTVLYCTVLLGCYIHRTGCVPLVLPPLLTGRSSRTKANLPLAQCPAFSIISIRASYMKPLWGILEINMKQLWSKLP